MQYAARRQQLIAQMRDFLATAAQDRHFQAVALPQMHVHG